MTRRRLVGMTRRWLVFVARRRLRQRSTLAKNGPQRIGATDGLTARLELGLVDDGARRAALLLTLVAILALVTAVAALLGDDGLGAPIVRRRRTAGGSRGRVDASTGLGAGRPGLGRGSLTTGRFARGLAPRRGTKRRRAVGLGTKLVA